MGIVKATLDDFIGDDCPRLAAAVSYYTVFSLPGLLVLVTFLAGLFVAPATLSREIVDQIQVLIGRGAAEQVGAILRNATLPGAADPALTALGLVALVFAATSGFANLQSALNRVWQVEPDPRRGGMVRNFLLKRVLSFVMILGVAGLLLVAVVSQTLLSAFGRLVSGAVPSAASGLTLGLVNAGLSLLAATALFGVLFQVLPDARVRWRDAWRGATITGVLFVVGNVLLGLYLAHSRPGSAYGAAGSLALILIWLYYSSMIFLLGAEATQVLARRRGEEIRPSEGAVRVVLEKRVIRRENGS